MNCISFNKGCYTGQELVTRTLRRGVVRKRIFPFRIINGTSERVEVGREIFHTNEKIGQIIACLGDVGIALCQLPGSPSLNERQSVVDELAKVSGEVVLDNGQSVQLMLPKYLDSADANRGSL
jgi:folate-binding Fe-S cluster repair protein YgfZ